MLLLLSGDKSLNPGHVHQNTLQCLNEWKVFKKRGLHFIHLNISSLLSKIEEVCYIAKSLNPVVIGNCKSKIDASVLDPEISMYNCKILRSDRNKQGGGVVCYVRNYLSYNTLNFHCEVESIFFETLLPISKAITVGTIYCLPSQINSLNNEAYIFGDFDINLYLNNLYILVKKYLK